jgi:prepilin-type N-terminal cleavage/methylation domain-containing protein
MNNERKHSGFSLTEVLIAVGILAVGMVFIAGVFPAGIYLTTVATERSIAAVVADEAFAKIRIYALGDLSTANDDVNIAELKTNKMMDFNDSVVFPATLGIDAYEFVYPSAKTVEPYQYCWSALCRLVEPEPNRLVQITVFISRKIGQNLTYFNHDFFSADVNWPAPVRIGVNVVPGLGHENELSIKVLGEEIFINDGYTIVDNATGRIYRVLERYKAPADKTILLDERWDGTSGDVWVVPPPLTPGTSVSEKKCSGRYPCIAVYQKVIRF